MRLFTCTNHDQHYPVGVASIVIAKDRRQAERLLDKELEKDGLNPHSKDSYSLHEINLSEAKAIILCNGDY